MGTPAESLMICWEVIGPVMRSGGAAKLKMEKLRMARTSVASLGAKENSDTDSEVAGDRCMITPVAQ